MVSRLNNAAAGAQAGRSTKSEAHGWAALSTLLAAALVGCAQTSAPQERVSTNELGDARAATRDQDWQAAASLWHEIFLRNDELCPEACLETARALIELEDPETAKSVLDYGLARYPENPSLLEMHGCALAQLGFSRAAESALEDALELEPDRPDTLLILARLRMDLGLYTGAVEALERRIELGSDDADTYYLAGRAYRGCGLFEEAYAAFERAFTAGPFDPLDKVDAAGMITRPRVRARVPEAERLSREWLQQATSEDPQLTTAHVLLGRTHELSDNLEGALESYRRAVETDPEDLGALTALARVYVETGDAVAAREIAQRALELEWDPDKRDALEQIVSGETVDF